MRGTLVVVGSVPTAFVERVEAAYLSRSGEHFRIALSGGSTARRCYESLAKSAVIDWSLVDVYWGDERCVPLHDPDSNSLLARESLLERLPVPVASATPMRCGEGAAGYASLLPGFLDFVHLGLGPDGHTASLFPGSAVLDAPPEARVVLSSDPSGLNRHPRMSITFGEIARAGAVVVTVEGVNKAWALREATTDGDVPAARIVNDHLVWLVDADAARDVSES
jgi:6-phosphogluconolactonase